MKEENNFAILADLGIIVNARFLLNPYLATLVAKGRLTSLVCYVRLAGLLLIYCFNKDTCLNDLLQCRRGFPTR